MPMMATKLGEKRKAKGNLGDIKVHIDRGNVKDLILMDQKGRTSPKKLRRFKEVSQKTADDGTGRKKQEEPEAILGTKKSYQLSTLSSGSMPSV